LACGRSIIPSHSFAFKKLSLKFSVYSLFFLVHGVMMLDTNVMSTLNGFEIASRVLSHLHQNELSTVNKDFLGALKGGS